MEEEIIYICEVCGLKQTGKDQMQVHEDRCIKQRDCLHRWEYKREGKLCRQCPLCSRVEVIAVPDDCPDDFWDYVKGYKDSHG